MHRGVREFIRWMEEHRDADGISLAPPAQARDIQAIEHHVGSPLPADLRLVLGRFNGAEMPTGILLTAAAGAGNTIEAALREVAQQQQRAGSFLDPDALLPFFRTEAGSVLAFDRSAAPVADTWPIVDFDPESGEVRLVHRTFDGWCLLCAQEWRNEVDTVFDLEKYLRQGLRHVEIEPDVSIAHVTVGHAQRRAGKPEAALGANLRGGRCVPPVPWADWEALKLAAILREIDALSEAAGRLTRRTPQLVWAQRGTTASRVAYVLVRALTWIPEGTYRSSVRRAIEHLADQGVDDEDKVALSAILAAARSGGPTPLPYPPQPTAVPAQPTEDAWWTAMFEAYHAGLLRDDDLVLDPSYDKIGVQRGLTPLLRIRRDF